MRLIPREGLHVFGPDVFDRLSSSTIEELPVGMILHHSTTSVFVFVPSA